MPSASRPVSALASVLLVVAIAASATAQSASPGWMYTTNITIDSGGAKRSSMALKYQVTARNLLMEFVQVSGMAEMGIVEGMTQILDDRDSSMTTVMPAQHMAMVMHLSDLLGSAPGMRAAMTPKIEPHVTSSNVEDLGPGERILGHATHRYRITTTGTMDVTIMGRTCTKRTDAVEEMWMAPDVDLMPAMQTMMKHYGTSTGVAAPDLQQLGASGPHLKGTALRAVSRTTAADATGKAVPVTTTTEYVEMSQAPIAASVFVVPADYQIMDTRKLMAEIPAGVMDSVMAKAKADGQEGGLKNLCGGVAKP